MCPSFLPGVLGVRGDRQAPPRNCPNMHVSFDAGAFPTEAAQIKTPVGWPMIWKSVVDGVRRKRMCKAIRDGGEQGAGGGGADGSDVIYPPQTS